ETAVFKIEELPFPEPPAAPPIPINRPTEDKAIHQEQAEPLPDQPPTETVAENIQEIPASQAVSTITENPAIPTDRQVTAAGVAEKQPEAPPEDIPNRLNNTVEQIEQTNPSSSDEISEPTLQPVELPPETEGKKESFLGGEIEETVPTNLPAAENLPKAQPASPVHEETKTEPDSEISSQPLQNQEPESPNQQPPVTAGVNGYDTSLIDIQDLITLQQNSPDENIEIITEELEPIDVAPYIYPGTKEPEDAIPSASQTPIEQQPLQNEPQPSVTEITQEVKQDKKPQPGKIELVAQIETTGKNESPGRPAAEKTQPPPIPPLLPESGNKTFKENPVLVSDDEFLIAQQLFTTQLTHSWEKLYHRSKPSRAEKVDESEFVFYTETAVH
ncbi:MAG TPA: hypothetical protein VJC37_08570, partial [Planctomycetota bacterium]|nr:hypothetical protein [Planctomycetota bacterium]